MGVDLGVHLSFWESFSGCSALYFPSHGSDFQWFSAGGQTLNQDFVLYGEIWSYKLQQWPYYYLEIVLNATFKRVSLSIALSHCTTHIHTQREPYVWQVKWGLGRGKRGWVVSGAHSCVSSNIRLGEQGWLSLSEADQLFLGRWSYRLLST